MEADSQLLPQEIVSNILKRLPVKTLIRFQCVCKPWKRLIKSSPFIAEQLHYATQKFPSLVFTRIIDYFPEKRGFSLRLCMIDCDMQVRDLPEPRLIMDRLDNQSSIVCSSNGLLCLRISKCRSCKYAYPPSLFVWNPAIREARLLPQTSLLVDYTGSFSLGFGFSPIINDHKILLIWFPDDSFDDSRAEVYSLSSCSWKVVECGLLVGMSLDSQTVTANGSMFWVGSKRRVNGYGGTRSDLKIVSFNIATEVFTLIPMPSHSFSFYRLAVFEKKLCIIAAPSYSPRSGSKIRWWVMEEERLNWSKKYISCPLSCPLSPLAVWKNEMVCYLDGSPSATESAGVNEEPSAALLNLATSGYRLFALPECFHAFDHVESLVPVRGNKYSCTCTF
ncbi:hypothetical protein DM860_008495 [Cuscuta australis]|uniref:F-box domain-containing protein n=1 Tax=Cuscuta australis TaxID=267555 RepID=A0A328D4U0_9ASTE|nr:hypothetical protein DM860_008495 [Cuscuta australis]